jgi:hypothetical protein
MYYMQEGGGETVSMASAGGGLNEGQRRTRGKRACPGDGGEWISLMYRMRYISLASGSQYALQHKKKLLHPHALRSVGPLVGGNSSI